METLAQRVVETPETPPAKTPKKEATNFVEITEAPLGKGYIKELLKLGESAGHFEMPKLTAEIDGFILSEIERQGFESNKKSYEDMVDEFMKKINLSDTADNYTKVEKLAELVRINKKLVDAMLEREAFMEKDPSEMTSSQLRRFIKEKL